MLRSAAVLSYTLLVQASGFLRRSSARLSIALIATMAFAVPGSVLAQAISTFAGTGAPGSSDDGPVATAAAIRFPGGGAFDGAGNFYFADTANHRVRKIAAGTGVLTTVAGNGSMAFSGDTGAATAASLSFPSAVAVSGDDLYIADTGNSRIRKVTLGIITTVAGNGTIGYSGDGGAATSASLYYPASVAVDGAKNIYLSDTYNHRVRVVAALTGAITTVAGNGTAGFSGDAGAATAASLQYPEGLAFNPAGTLFVADTYNHRVRSIGGTIATVAGNGTAAFAGDGAAAVSASLNYPSSVASDTGGNLFIADYANHRVRVAPATGGMISTFAGSGAAGYAGDSGPAVTAGLHYPVSVVADVGGNVYVSDRANQRLRKVGDPLASPGAAVAMTLNVVKSGGGVGTIASSPAGISCGGSCFTMLPTGTVVTLTATPAEGSTFEGWSGSGCSGTGTCTVTLSAAATVTASFAGAAVSARLVNMSTRAYVQGGEGATIGGFAIGGSVAKTVLILARGPSLAGAGVPAPLANPRVTLVNQITGQIVTFNDDWGSSPNAAAIAATGKAPTQAVESAILIALNPGNYTAVVDSPLTGTTGNAIVELYEIDQPGTPLLNISTRGQVLTDNNVMIGGFVIEGNGPQQVLILARGPSLAGAGVSAPLANPRVTLVNQSTGQIVTFNDDWGSAPNVTEIIATGKAPTQAVESAILISLNPGSYTAVVDGGVARTTGIGIIEVFKQ